MAPLHEVFGDEIAAALGAPTGESSQNTLSLQGKRNQTSPSGSTRASSPGCESSTSDGLSAPSPGVTSHTCGSLAERRGLRAAILNDLGVGLDAASGNGSCSSSPDVPSHVGLASVPSPSVSAHPAGTKPCLTATHPRSLPMAAVVDVSQRRPPLPPASQITGTQSPANQRNTPTINSMLTGSFLGSSPGSPCDASQRSPARTPALAPSSWGNAANCAEATRAAATGNPSSMLCSRPPMTPAQMFPPAAPTRPILSSVPRSSYQQGYQSTSPMAQNAFLLQSPSAFNSAAIGFDTVSNEELAERLRVAAPDVYED